MYKQRNSQAKAANYPQKEMLIPTGEGGVERQGEVPQSPIPPLPWSNNRLAMSRPQVANNWALENTEPRPFSIAVEDTTRTLRRGEI